MIDVAKDLGLVEDASKNQNIILTISPPKRTQSEASEWNQNVKVLYDKENYLQVQTEINDIYYDDKDRNQLGSKWYYGNDNETPKACC